MGDLRLWKFTPWVTVFGLLTGSGLALGWGNYGHEQINNAAVDILSQKGSALGACFKKNRDMIVRLGITPDFDWKKYSPVDKDKTQKALFTAAELSKLWSLQLKADKSEHPLHYFEADAFVTQEDLQANALASVAALPHDIDFPTVLPKYKGLLKDNLPTVLKIAWEKKIENEENPTLNDVAEHGTSPWRIAQLFKLGVDELKKGNLELAFIYLGAMGHYVGDMSQQFHASMNFDGGYYVPPASGVHHTYEESILEDYAREKTKGIKLNDHKLWPTFVATNDAVVKAANDALAKLTTPLGIGEIVHETLSLVGSGYPAIYPLLGAFTFANTGETGAIPGPDWKPPKPTNATHAQARQASHPPHALLHGHDREDGEEEIPPDEAEVDPAENAPGAAERAPTMHADKRKIFRNSDYLDPKRKQVRTSVLALAEQRMGASSALLVRRMWELALSTAAAENSGLKKSLASCPAIEFTRKAAIEKYPPPDYLIEKQ